MYRCWIFAILMIGVLALPACAGTPHLFVGLTSDKMVYHAEEPLGVALTVLNQGRHPYRAAFSSGLKYDFILSDPSDKEVWRWSWDKMFTQAFTELILKPQIPQTWVVIIEPKVLRPGKYRLTAIFKTTEKLFQTESMEIEVN
jgi:hypothetical protein